MFEWITNTYYYYFNNIKYNEVNFNYVLKNRLKNDRVKDVDELFEMLLKTNSVIAGSYPLQVYLGEKWNKSDLDIFTFSEEMIKYLEEKYGNGVNITIKYLSKKHKNSKYKYFSEQGKLDKVIEFKTETDFKVQVIRYMDLIEDVNVVDYTFDRFDFNFCKVGFDGKELHIFDKNSVINKMTNYDLNHKLTPKTLERLLKYEKRGFVLINKQDFIKKFNRKYGKENI